MSVCAPLAEFTSGTHRAAGTAAVLLSTYNGRRFLGAQLDSLLAQRGADWRLYWRDDGSTDGTPALLRGFAARAGAGRCVPVAGPAGRIGCAASFFTLLRAVVPLLGGSDAVAFADQDDVWLPDKLARGMAALGSVPAEIPALYCARQMLVDAALRPLGPSAPFTRDPGFPAALTGNVASGCTTLLNRAAARLVADSDPPPGTLHDWWCYLLVAAAGGPILADNTPVLLYRQHEANLVGARRSRLARGFAALRRGPGPFMADFRRHLAGLAAHADRLTPRARQDIARLQSAIASGPFRRLRALAIPGLRRSHWDEGLLFALWFVID